ncbi:MULTISPECIES: YesL family protein [unclassified Bifidobacterium]|uniref:YesL family protein n=1 Tax=unclassified Bifidobacterium TaxID=2608897 RepID=UPI00112AC3D9|nr:MULTISPECIES: YesL family protein [unclassified Bifidobacterium]TPF84828.1 beta-carotene 15,15'-monooxygenase [Bifidobacterium sp. UTCIF-36]TPF88910.1 beta-carotene 15,15'-monooxygenase [Bifidobacterium sp. UTBIF-56]
MGFMSPDSAFMRGLSNTVDAIWINLLMIITSIPLITIGAALTAGHDAARRVAIAEGHVTANYFKAFRANFLKATGLWIIFGATGAALVYSWVVLQITPLLIPKIGLTLVWIIGFEWVWALQARFENSFGGVLANAFIFGVSRIGATLVLVTIDAIFLGLLVASWVYMPQGLFLLIVLGYGSVLMLHVPILERVFAAYVAGGGNAPSDVSAPSETSSTSSTTSPQRQ